MLKTLKLHGIGPVKDLSASFGERLNALTGDNGLGKSFLLDVAFWVLTGTWPGGRVAIPETPAKNNGPTITSEVVGKKKAVKRTASFNFHNQSWKREEGRPPMPGLVVYAAVDGSFAVWDPARNYWREAPSGLLEETETPRAYQFTPEELRDGIRVQDRYLCEGLVRDWVRWYDRRTNDGPDSPFVLLERVIGRLSHPDERMTPDKPRRVFLEETREFPTVTMPYGSVAYPHFSAGVKRIINLAYLLVWAWTEHRIAAQLRNEAPTDRLVLLVDEVEAHLHPKWQRTILPAILQVADSLGAQVRVQVLTATHSPLVLASLEPLFDEETDRLFWFDLCDAVVHFRLYPWAQQGDVIGWLTSELFGLKQARSKEAEEAIESAEAYMRGERAGLPEGLRTKDQIHQALKRLLPGLDPFWPRWIVRVQHDAI
jgi:hypothetical protein